MTKNHHHLHVVVMGALFAALPSTYACGSGSSSSLQYVLGGNVAVGSALPARTGSESPISSASQLSCSDWGSSYCRWRNEPNGNADNLDWAAGTGQWDTSRAQQAFGVPPNSMQPNSPWAITGTAPANSQAIALLVSDPIPCQLGDGYLTLRCGTTRAPRPTHIMQGRNYAYCTPPISDGDPGPAQFTIPGPIMQTFELVLEASGFTASISGYSGGTVIIDDLNYQANGVGMCQGNFGK